MRKQYAKKIAGTVMIPLLTLAVLLVISAFQQVLLFDGTGSWMIFFRATASVTLTTFALAINLNSGRFDFSLGSVAVFSSVLSATVALQYNLSPWGMLILSIIFGAALGAISGLIYIFTHIPPIIASLGITLLYEGATYAFTGGKGVSLVTCSDLIRFPSIINYILVLIAAVGIIVILLDYTRFGSHYRALMSGQKIAVETGIREKPNAVACYIIAGSLMGVVGFISATSTGSIQMSLNFGSIGVMFTAFLPMFIGSYIGRFSNEKIGIMLGAATTALISLAYARFDTSSAAQSIVSAMILVCFLIYLNNQHTIKALLQGKPSLKRNQSNTMEEADDSPDR